MASPYTVIITDDHAFFRQHLKRMLEDMEAVQVIGEAGDGLELLRLLRHLNPDLILLDISMPKLSGIGAACQLKTIFPQVKVLILTSYEDENYLQAAISARVAGYILKQDLETDLFSAINTIRLGRTYFSPRIYGKLPEADEK